MNEEAHEEHPLCKLVAGTRYDEGCWRWLGVKGRNGGGAYKSDAARKIVYALVFGPVPKGYQVILSGRSGCHFSDCIRPSHLDAIPPYSEKRISLCKRGHSLENAYVRARLEWSITKGMRVARTSRECRVCRNSREREARSRVRQMAA